MTTGRRGLRRYSRAQLGMSGPLLWSLLRPTSRRPTLTDFIRGCPILAAGLALRRRLQAGLRQQRHGPRWKPSDFTGMNYVVMMMRLFVVPPLYGAARLLMNTLTLPDKRSSPDLLMTMILSGLEGWVRLSYHIKPYVGKGRVLLVLFRIAPETLGPRRRLPPPPRADWRAV